MNYSYGFLEFIKLVRICEEIDYNFRSLRNHNHIASLLFSNNKLFTRTNKFKTLMILNTRALLNVYWNLHN